MHTCTLRERPGDTGIGSSMKYNRKDLWCSPSRAIKAKRVRGKWAIQRKKMIQTVFFFIKRYLETRNFVTIQSLKILLEFHIFQRLSPKMCSSMSVWLMKPLGWVAKDFKKEWWMTILTKILYLLKEHKKKSEKINFLLWKTFTTFPKFRTQKNQQIK